MATLGLLSVASSGFGASVSTGTTFTGSITLTSSQTDDYFVYDANGGTLQGTKGVGVTLPFVGTNYIPAGTFTVSETIPDYITSGVATAVGLYSPAGVSVAVNQATYNSALNAETWAQVFTNTPESSVVTALQNGDSTALESFLTQYSTDFLNFSSNSTSSTSGGILHFSNATDGGSLTFSATAFGTAPGGNGSGSGSGSGSGGNGSGSGSGSGGNGSGSGSGSGGNAAAAVAAERRRLPNHPLNSYLRRALRCSLWPDASFAGPSLLKTLRGRAAHLRLTWAALFLCR